MLVQMNDLTLFSIAQSNVATTNFGDKSQLAFQNGLEDRTQFQFKRIKWQWPSTSG